MGVFLTVDVIATVAGAILSDNNTCLRDGPSGRASGKECWNAERKVNSGRCFSYYYQTLEEVPKVRYNEKLPMLAGVDPEFLRVGA